MLARTPLKLWKPTAVRISLFCLLLISVAPLADGVLSVAAAQESVESGKGPVLGDEVTTKLKLGVTVKATGNMFNGIANIPIPSEWPEQKVKVFREDVTSNVKRVTERDISGGGGLKQMVVEIPQLAGGQEAHAIVIYEITRRKMQPPADTSIYRIPKKLDRAMQLNLGPSPMIESRHPKIVAAAKKAVADAGTAWDQVDAIANYVRTNVQFKEGKLKGAAKALLDGEGYTDELVSLFVAMCRSQKIPARTVFVKGDCYAEFYLEDDNGEGYWFPCVLTGGLPLGTLDEVRPALQKGDNFKNPENTKESLRYVREFFQAAGRGGSPKVEFISEPVAN